MSFSVIPSDKFKKEAKRLSKKYPSYVVKDNKEVYLLTIYDKSEFEKVDDKTLRNIIQSLNFGD
jgi:mRNA-degrading endonuclease RelE of RelBE toxin-antitoxin system